MTAYIYSFFMLSSCGDEKTILYDKASSEAEDANYSEFVKTVSQDLSLCSAEFFYDKSTLLHSLFSFVDNPTKRIKIAEFILKNGGDINALDDSGNTVAHSLFSGNAASENREVLIEFLIRKGISTDHKNSDGKLYFER